MPGMAIIISATRIFAFIANSIIASSEVDPITPETAGCVAGEPLAA